jgi:predicted nucleotidyltransferase
MTPAAQNDPVLRYFKTAVAGALGKHLREIVLFGYRARGDAKAGSDYDLLVVVDKVSPQLVDDIDDIAGEALVHHGAVISAIPISEEDRAKRRYSPLLIQAAREGISV